MTDSPTEPKPGKAPRRVGAAGVAEIVLLLSIGYAVHLYYNLIGHIASLRGVDFGPRLLTPLDAAIPYLPFCVQFYQLAYVAPLALVALSVPRVGADMAFYRRLWASFLVLLLVHFTLYLLVPTSARSVRVPDEMIGHGLNGELVRYQYRVVTAWCAWPSLHVSACWFFYRALGPQLPSWRRVYLIWFAGMMTATAVIKIHYALDGVTGLLVAELAYRLVLRRMQRTEWSPGQSLESRKRLALLAVMLVLVLGGLAGLTRLTGFEGPALAQVPLSRLWTP